ncbi:hypothetical protein NXS19_007382 [Fusarium pseudograminearum]|nr:hypothetical protein NXS19_007382 [Fusarium pseudograminearum]
MTDKKKRKKEEKSKKVKYHFVADAGWLDWRHVCFVSSVLLTAPLWRLLFLSRNFLRSAIYKMKPTIPRLDNRC